jgi:hypothetical protein
MAWWLAVLVDVTCLAAVAFAAAWHWRDRPGPGWAEFGLLCLAYLAGAVTEWAHQRARARQGKE